MSCNQVKLSGIITKIYPLRHTPAGVKILRFVLEHDSKQEESGALCRVKCRMFCVWVNPGLDKITEYTNVEVAGFISQNAKLQLVLHIIEFLDKGN